MFKNYLFKSILAYMAMLMVVTMLSCSSGGDDEDDYNPTTEKEKFECPRCGGSGICEDVDWYTNPKYCHGTGWCHNCDGTGWTQVGKNGGYDCVYCDGTGVCGACGGNKVCSYCFGDGWVYY